MKIGLLQLELIIHNSRSLKQKRSITKGLKQNIRNRFNVSISEIDNFEKWGYTTLALSTVSTDSNSIYRIFNKIINFIEFNYDVDIVNESTELL
ncbi:MAG: DUF503 domain-containing protein [Fidelibacterota bacterium]